MALPILHPSFTRAPLLPGRIFLSPGAELTLERRPVAIQASCAHGLDRGWLEHCSVDHVYSGTRVRPPSSPFLPGLSLTHFSRNSQTAPRRWQTPYIPALLALSVLFAVTFLWWEARCERMGRPTMLALSIFKIPHFGVLLFVASGRRLRRARINSVRRYSAPCGRSTLSYIFPRSSKSLFVKGATSSEAIEVTNRYSCYRRPRRLFDSSQWPSRAQFSPCSPAPLARASNLPT